MNWSDKAQRLAAWGHTAAEPFPQFEVTELRAGFDACLAEVDREFSALANLLFVFVPDNWETEDDWLLSKEQWTYLTAMERA